VLPWRRRPWRQDKGLFFEIFPSEAYLRESFEKGAKKDGLVSLVTHGTIDGDEVGIDAARACLCT
jgi:hypothetical protein